MIVVFGTKRCKHCAEQRGHLSKTFGSEGSGWEYVDIAEQPEALRIAEEINVEHIPAVVVFDGSGKEVLRREGRLAPDQAFRALHGRGAIPVPQGLERQALEGKPVRSYLTQDPLLSSGDEVKVLTYAGKDVCGARVVSCIRKDIRALNSRERLRYAESGGRSDVAWVVEFRRTDTT